MADDALGGLKNAAEEEGVRDLAQGAGMLSLSEDIAALSALLRAAGEDDVERGMDLAAMSGQTAVVAEIVGGLDFPALSGFLAGMSNRLRTHAVAQLVESGDVGALSRALDTASAGVAEAGVAEVAEGLTALAVSEAMADVRDTTLDDDAAQMAAELADLAAAQGKGDADVALGRRGLRRAAGLASGPERTPAPNASNIRQRLAFVSACRASTPARCTRYSPEA